MPNRILTWNSPVVVFSVVFCLVLTTATLVTRALYANARGSANPEAPAFVTGWKDLAVTGQSRGPRNAPVTVVVFTDYQCPGCAELHRQLAAASDSMPAALRVVTRHFPLSSHPHAPAAANAAECAAELGRFSEFETVVYAQQDSIGTKPWIRFASDAGVRDTADFSRCVAKRRHASTVDRDLKVSRELKLTGTPAYFVNGAPYVGAPPAGRLLQDLRAAQRAIAASDTVARKTTANVAQGPDTANNGPPVARRWLAPLALERTITGPDRDELLMPSSLAVAGDSLLVFFDFGNMEVRAFNLHGSQVWRVGRKGRGPSEFQNAMDVKKLGNGNIAVLDMSNRRITTLTASGRVLRSIPVNLSSHRFVPFADTTVFALATDDSTTLWSSVNTSGDSARRVMAPATLVARHGMERETFSAPLGAGAVISYRWADKIAVLAPDGSVRRIVNGVETVAFPGTKSYARKFGKFSGYVSRISPTATPATLSVTTRGDLIFVLFAGASANRGRIVDVYQSSDGMYLGSHLLPFPALELVALPDGAFATLRSEPVPSLDIWTATNAGSTRTGDGGRAATGGLASRNANRATAGRVSR
ncbi:MAG: thioredoxin domain-containing protein [Phycisphaerae bacterium]|nr:thioredoxin domain-containing protein [Gemmatimonadaceae bacterium]